ncbi:ankyrin repeat-containing domain protein [Thelonectria olida]|uniref:Ankyrin repeat-containing domain protein n=1 Tax=Thelonectria olida TaxID=1576542 RepID=A0A9P8VYT2_9HYPO|nr:ankyrin repeat-containing domain protein [Thelonectria olida]
MEVLGAVASSIAVAQGIAAGGHLVKMLRDIPEIQKEFDSLRGEIDLIGAIVKEATRVGCSTSTQQGITDPFEQSLLSRTAQQLQEIGDELNAIVTQCGRETSDKKIEARRRKWLLQGDKMQKLRQKALDAKLNLHFALTCHHRSTLQEQFNSELRTQFESFVFFLKSRHPPESFRNAENLLEASSSEINQSDDDNNRRRVDDLQAETVKHDAPATILRSDDMNTTLKFRTIKPMSRTGCSEFCRCQCHFDRKQLRSSNLLQPFLGSCLVGYKLVSNMSRPKCTDQSCKRRSEIHISVEYSFPRWLWVGMLTFMASYTGATGLRCALRPRRIIPVRHRVWDWLAGPAEVFRDAVENGEFVYFPDETDNRGTGLLEVGKDEPDCSLDRPPPDLTNWKLKWAMDHRSYKNMELLLGLWEDLLPQVPRYGPLSSSVFEVNQTLSFRENLTDHQIYLLQKVASLADVAYEIRETRVCQAIKRGEGVDGVQTALREEPWAIDMLDSLGMTPLHLAIVAGRVDIVELLIAEQADVNQGDFKGQTPLMEAAMKPSPESIRLLLKGKCLVEQKCPFGNTALHMAVSHGRVDSVGILLAAGASANTRNIDGARPLHFLADPHCTPGDLEAILGLLLAINDANLGAQDNYGLTVALWAIARNNLPLLRCLAQEHVSFHITDVYSRNVLHWAASWSSLEVLRFLVSLNLSGIDTELRDMQDDTPWDCFIFAIHSPEIHLGHFLRPSGEEQQAFVELFRGIRNKNLSQDICRLEQIVQELSGGDPDTARASLTALIGEKTGRQKGGLISWYRTLIKQIESGDLALVTETIEDYLVELRELMQSSPWSKKSRWDPQEDDEEESDGKKGTGGEEEEDCAVDEETM